ncbi:hypothetical protein PS645_01777 [Pseudomonas fluorescens]|uniref:Uncharacterized protein n=1 Tax=Pseudomonas fluorescens TaxID=294 RepID=A0A5E6RR64_PSEFL|nr:hypothetical protein PS645_01777 [Pseudomonas fluorescens]
MPTALRSRCLSGAKGFSKTLRSTWTQVRLVLPGGSTGATGAAIGGSIKDTVTPITTYCHQVPAKEDLVSDQAIASNLGACKV